MEVEGVRQCSAVDGTLDQQALPGAFHRGAGKFLTVGVHYIVCYGKREALAGARRFEI